MKEKKDILEDLKMKQNPYTVREGYFDFIESRVNDKIDNPAKSHSVWMVAKPALLLACSFLIIFGIGYGTLSLTNTLSTEAPLSESAEASFDSFMEDLYYSESDAFNIDGQITDEEMFEFVSEYYSSQYIENYFASAE